MPMTQVAPPGSPMGTNLGAGVSSAAQVAKQVATHALANQRKCGKRPLVCACPSCCTSGAAGTFESAPATAHLTQSTAGMLSIMLEEGGGGSSGGGSQGCADDSPRSCFGEPPPIELSETQPIDIPLGAEPMMSPANSARNSNVSVQSNPQDDFESLLDVNDLSLSDNSCEALRDLVASKGYIGGGSDGRGDSGCGGAGAMPMQ